MRPPIECLQYSAKWWHHRRGVPTASEFSRIITPAKGEPSKSMLDYACQLIADLYDPDYGRKDDYVSAAMREGTELEPEARRVYECYAGEPAVQVGFCLDDEGRFGCSPDALVGEVGVLELKCPKPSTHVRYLLDDCLPDEYKPQVHGHLLVTGRAWCDFVSWCPGMRPLIVRIVPDDYTVKLRARLEEFWAMLQQTKFKLELDPPPVWECEEEDAVEADTEQDEKSDLNYAMLAG